MLCQSHAEVKVEGRKGHNAVPIISGGHSGVSSVCFLQSRTAARKGRKGRENIFILTAACNLREVDCVCVCV